MKRQTVLQADYALDGVRVSWLDLRMKSHLIPAILAVLTALPATAQNLRPEEAATLPRIIDHQCLDLIEDMIGCENVILLAGEEDAADLLILPDARDTENTAPILIARNFA